MSERFRRINAVIDALKMAGLADDNTQRVVIDVKAGHLPVVYTQKILDVRFLDVIQTLEGLEVKAITNAVAHGCEVNDPCLWNHDTGLHSDGTTCRYYHPIST